MEWKAHRGEKNDFEKEKRVEQMSVGNDGLAFNPKFNKLSRIHTNEWIVKPNHN